MFKKTILLTAEERRKVSEMCGNIMRGVLEYDSIWHISEKLNLEPWQVNHNIDEMLYELRRYVGRWRYLKILFMR